MLDKSHLLLNESYQKVLCSSSGDIQTLKMDRDDTHQSQQQLDSRLKSLTNAKTSALYKLRGQVSTFEGNKEELIDFIMATLDSLIEKNLGSSRGDCLNCICTPCLFHLEPLFTFEYWNTALFKQLECAPVLFEWSCNMTNLMWHL